MLKFSEIYEFSEEKFRKIPILKGFEWFEWFGPSPTEPFNSVPDSVTKCGRSKQLSVSSPCTVDQDSRSYLGPLRYLSVSSTIRNCILFKFEKAKCLQLLLLVTHSPDLYSVASSEL